MCYPGTEDDLKKIRRPKRLEIVIPGPIDFAIVHISQYLNNSTRFELRPNDKEAGFTREEIIWGIVQMYRYVYAVELDTMSDFSTHQNPMSYNRSATNGRYKIWGHDLVDLVLHTAYWDASTRELRVGMDS